MVGKDILLNLFEEMNVELDEYLYINKILIDIDKVIEDYTKIDILDENLKAFDEISKKIIFYIKLQIKNNLEINETELKNSILYIRNEIEKKLPENAEYYEALWEMVCHFKNLKDVIESNLKSDYNLILEFIELCYKEKKLTIEQAINLNFEVVNSLIEEKMKNEYEEEVILEENEVSIQNELENLFIKYDYDFNKLKLNVKDMFNKYAKLDYTEYILSKLKAYNVTQNDLERSQKTILNIILDRKNNTFDEICKFIDENNCSMNKLLEISSVFHRKKKSFISKKLLKITEDGDKVNSSKERKPIEELTICGTYDDFKANIDLFCSYDDSITINNEYFRVNKTVLTSPHNKIKSNLAILRQYGISKPNEIPKEKTCLIGKYTAYQLDRFIEVGLHDYIKNNTSYICRPKSPFKFYKIRRGQDLGDIITSKAGMKRIYTSDNEDAHGISRVLDNPDDETKKYRIIQEELDRSVLDEFPDSSKRDIRYRYDKLFPNEYYKNLNSISYRFQEFTPSKIFFGKSTSSISRLLDSILELDEYNTYFEYGSEVLEDKYIKMLDTAYCRTVENNGENTYDIKTDENTYTFRPLKFPNAKITISRQKVLRLCYLLKKNDIWIEDDYSLEDKVDFMLSVLVKDSVLSYWELNYLRNILKTIIPNTLEKERRGRK